MDKPDQRLWVYQQQGSAEAKISGLREHGRGIVIARVVSIDEALPVVLDEPEPYLPDPEGADVVLDFLRHPDLTDALARRCLELKLPIVASGRRLPVKGLITPPT